jgi:hypothetical protein
MGDCAGQYRLVAWSLSSFFHLALLRTTGFNVNHGSGETRGIDWPHLITRKGGHWSVPFELGAALTGVPSVNVTLTSGQACNAQGQNCVYVATDPNVQANLQAQIAKYRNDLNPLRFYPIAYFGVAYNFKIR